MTHNKRPEPLYSTAKKKGTTCPVCGFTSYSREGIHPQCSQQKADDVRVARMKKRQSQTEKQDAKAKTSATVKPWHKVCPKCRCQVHVRRSSCTCGHKFAAVKSANKPPGTL